MPKKVRIENIDSAATRSHPYRVQVLVYEETFNLAGRLVEEIALNNPCDQVEVEVYPGRYLVISELPAQAADADTTPGKPQQKRPQVPPGGVAAVS